MKRVTIHRAFLAGAVMAALSFVGCDDSTNGPSAWSNPTPEESFELIVETFRRGVEDIPIGFVVQREGGHSMMSGRHEVSHELIAPAKEGDPYRGLITVDSEWKYSVQRSDEPDEPDSDQQSSQQDSSLDDGQDPSGLEIRDPDLVSGSLSAPEGTQPSPKTGARRVTREHDEKARTYELLYQDGRWTLITELDEDTERAIENAFEKAGCRIKRPAGR